jgi:hypothetical protein
VTHPIELPAQRSNIHGNGKGLSGDVQLGSDSAVVQIMGKMGDTWREVETFTKTGETDQGVTVVHHC